jgi:two-component system sensor histidine kinase UhpB
MVGSSAGRDPGKVSLFSRVVGINAGVLVAAALVLALSPATVSPTLQVAEAAVLAVGTVLMISVNVILLRRVFGPLERLTALMRRIVPHAPGRRLSL